MLEFGKGIILIGVVLILIGSIVVFLPKVPFLGKLPGDIRIERENFTFYFPVVSCIFFSLLLSLLFWFFRRK